jgi:hypothetical protein
MSNAAPLPPGSGNVQMSNFVAIRAAQALAASDARAKANSNFHRPAPVVVKVQAAVNEALAVASVPAAPAARPNMTLPPRQPIASVGAGSTRGAMPAAPFIPATARPAPAASVGVGAAKRPVAGQPAPEPLGTPARPSPVTVESIEAAIAANHVKAMPKGVTAVKPVAPTPRVMAPGKSVRK